MSNIYLGIDVGSKTLGLAIGKHGFAFATTTLYFPEHDFDHASHQLLSYMKQEQINYLVIGYPKRLNNHKSSTTIMIEKFLAIIEQLLMIEQSDMPIKL